MKLLNMFFLILIFLTNLPSGFGQESPKAHLYDEFGKICSEDFMARYDGYLVSLYNDPNSTGYVLFYGDETLEGRNLNFLNALKKHPEMRKFDKSRFVFRRGENRPQMHIQFWIVPAGAEAPATGKEFVQEKIVTTTLFDKNWADFYRNEYDRKLEIYEPGFLDLGCEFSPNVREFADILLSNPDLNGYLVVYTKFGKGAKRGNQVAAFAVTDLMKNYKVPRNRLKTIYGGNREKPEIELWFVPKGDKPPVPKPDSKPKK